MPRRSLERLINSINERSNADFVNRLKQGATRTTIPDWENSNSVATHKMSYATDDKGNAIVYPNVQNLNGFLYDFTRPGNGEWDALDSAIERGDTLMMTPREADEFTKNYKKYYPSFNYRRSLQD